MVLIVTQMLSVSVMSHRQTDGDRQNCSNKLHLIEVTYKSTVPCRGRRGCRTGPDSDTGAVCRRHEPHHLSYDSGSSHIARCTG